MHSLPETVFSSDPTGGAWRSTASTYRQVKEEAVQCLNYDLTR
jgi:hypothetical protein